MLQSIRDRLGIDLGSNWHRVGTTWDRFGIEFGGINLKLSWDQFGIDLGIEVISIWERVGINLKSDWDTSGIQLGSWYQIGIEWGPIWDRSSSIGC